MTHARCAFSQRVVQVRCGQLGVGEFVALLREFHWRMGEMERAVLLRAHQMPADDQTLVQQMIDTLKGTLPAEA